jgi:hypothetical protein
MQSAGAMLYASVVSLVCVSTVFVRSRIARVPIREQLQRKPFDALLGRIVMVIGLVLIIYELWSFVTTGHFYIEH